MREDISKIKIRTGTIFQIFKKILYIVKNYVIFIKMKADTCTLPHVEDFFSLVGLV